MRVAVSSSGKDLDSQIDPRFGRCAYFLIVETDDMEFEAFDNENVALGGGAGIQSAQFVASLGAKAVITGNCGPNAVRTLSAAGIELFVGQTGTVTEAIERHKHGKLSPTSEANVADHYGMGMGRGMGMGPGMGMGRGTGRGRGMGRGMGGGMGMSGGKAPGQKDADSLTKDQELRALKQEAGELKKQMGKIEAQIKKLEKND